MRAILLAFVFSVTAVTATAQQEPPLIRLTKQATSPQMRHVQGRLRSDRETNLAGWLVLNGARFRNAEYPALAKHLVETYAARGIASLSDAEFTQLPYEPNESDSHGQVVRGMAICPAPVLCGDLIGILAPFNLEASL